MTYELDHQDIRDGIARLCQDFAGDYWQACDKDDAYPSAFVNRLTEEGYLSALIPEAYGGLGLSLSAGGAILEEIHRSGGNAAAWLRRGAAACSSVAVRNIGARCTVKPMA